MADDLVELCCPPGAEQYPISFGTQEFHPYRVDHLDEKSGWRVRVTREAAVDFLRRGGFSLPKDTVIMRSTGTIRIRHREGPRSFSFRGIEFQPDEDGVVTAPIESCEDGGWKSHPGWEVAPDPAPKAAEKPVPPAPPPPEPPPPPPADAADASKSAPKKSAKAEA